MINHGGGATNRVYWCVTMWWPVMDAGCSHHAEHDDRAVHWGISAAVLWAGQILCNSQTNLGTGQASLGVILSSGRMTRSTRESSQVLKHLTILSLRSGGGQICHIKIFKWIGKDWLLAVWFIVHTCLACVCLYCHHWLMFYVKEWTAISTSCQHKGTKFLLNCSCILTNLQKPKD